MLDLYYWTTPNGHKITMFLEETQLPYRMHAINLQKSEQSTAEFLKISPNGKMPAIIDHDPLGGGGDITLFESGAILQYLAEKSEQLLPAELPQRFEVLQWLYWQVSGFSPMAGQQVFFRRAAEQVPFAIDRFTQETTRLYGVLNRRLADRAYLAGETFSIADISAYPWAAPYEMLHQNIDSLPHVERWLDLIARRPATQRAYAIAKEINPSAPTPPAPRKR
jgi:GSH-dependent disulfide-bond oxidoreductase